MGTQQFCLKWNNHHSNMLAVFEQLLSSEALVDVTLACEGLSLKAHKMVLSACSPFFQSLFLENPCKHPIVILKDMRYTDLKAIIDFMYRGEVNVSQDQLSALLKTAETLKVKGLAEVTSENRQGNATGVIQQEIIQTTVPPSGAQQQHRAESPPLSRRKRGRPRRRSLSDSNRSDSEDQIPSKIKEPDSPEIIEDVNRDLTSDSLDGRQRLSLMNHPQTQVSTSQPPTVPHLPVASHKSLPSIHSQDGRATTEEPTSGDEGDFDVEPSKLMEQSMTTENCIGNSPDNEGLSPVFHVGEMPASTSPHYKVPVFPDGQAPGPTLPPASTQLALPSSSTPLVDTRPHHMVASPAGDSQSLVPVSLASDPSIAGHTSQDSNPDIKPGALVSYEEPPISPVAGPSHDNSSSMLMFMDTSGVPAIPGPSNYQPDKQSPSQQPSQGFQAEVKLGRRPTPHICKLCGKFFQSTFEFRRHQSVHQCGRQKFHCQYCSQTFYYKSTLYRHIRETHDETHPLLPASPDLPSSKKRGRQPGSRLCAMCKKVFSSSGDYNDHLAMHWEAGDLPNSEHPVMEETPSVIDVEANSLEFSAMNIEPPVTCVACQTKLGSFASFSYHLMSSTGCRVRQFNCSQCSKSFIWPTTLLRHVRDQHTGHEEDDSPQEWPLCNVCHKTFLNKTGLMLHINKFHPDEAAFKNTRHNSSETESPGGPKKRGRKPGTRLCRLCKKTFASTEELLQHCWEQHNRELSRVKVEEDSTLGPDEEESNGS